MNNIVTVISPVDATHYQEMATGNRATIAFLLALMPRNLHTPLVVVDGDKEMPAAQFIAQIYGTGPVFPQPTARPT